jgi:hypothetical protein
VNIAGIGLANGPQDIARVISLGCDHYLALEGELDFLLQVPGERYLRLWEQGIRNKDAGGMADIARKVRTCRRKGIRHIVPWNEQNLSTEGGFPDNWMGSAEHRRLLYSSVASKYSELVSLLTNDDVILHFPAWCPHEFYREHLGDWKWAVGEHLDLHCYGTVEQMLEIVDWYISSFPGTDLYITEWNFGAGNRVDPDWWAGEAVRFLNEIWKRPQVVCAIGFIWKWHRPDSHLITTLDWEGQPIEKAVRQMPKPQRQTGETTVNEQEYLRWAADVYRRAGVLRGFSDGFAFNPASGITGLWLSETRAGRYPGEPTGPEHPTENKRYILQEFASAVIYWDSKTNTAKRGLPFE